MQGSHPDKNDLPGEKFAGLRLKLLIAGGFFFPHLLFIFLWKVFSKIQNNFAPFCEDIAGGLGISKQWVVISQSLHVAPYGISGFSDAGM